MRALSSLLAGTLLAQPALAAESTFAGAVAPGQLVGPPQSTVSAQFGGTWTAGNASSYLITTSLTTSRRWSRNRSTLALQANIGRARADTNGDGHLDAVERAATPAETARRLFAEFRQDRYVSDRDSVYLLGGPLADPFAGFDVRSHVQAGFSRTLVSEKHRSVVVEVGGDAAYEDVVDGVASGDQAVFALRAMARGSYRFNDSVSANGQIEALENVLDPADLRVLGSASLTARLTTLLDVRLGTQVTYDHQPVEGFVPFDQVTTASLVASVR